MRIALMHNPTAGGKHPSGKDLVSEFEQAGHQVEYLSTKQQEHLPEALKAHADVVVVAGGDGTVRKVATRLLGQDVPITILPVGTVNNIARALGLQGSLRQLIQGLATARQVKLDVGVAKGAWGEVPFLEAAGTGLFPHMIAERKTNIEQGVPDAVEALGGLTGGVHFLQHLLQAFHGLECVIHFDGTELKGNYLLVEAMNIPSIGPAVELAPDARPCDGLLDMVFLREDQREKLDSYLAARLANKGPIPFPVQRTRQITMSCSATQFHFDDQCWESGPPDRSAAGASGRWRPPRRNQRVPRRAARARAELAERSFMQPNDA